MMGMAALHKLNRSVTFTKKMQNFIGEISAEIRYNATPIDEIIHKMCRKNKELPDFVIECDDLCRNDINFPVAWEKAVKEKAIQSGADKEDLDDLLSLGKSLGATDIEGQITCCDLFKSRIDEKFKKVTEIQSKQSKLYLTLGTSLGIAIALVIL